MPQAEHAAGAATAGQERRAPARAGRRGAAARAASSAPSPQATISGRRRRRAPSPGAPRCRRRSRARASSLTVSPPQRAAGAGERIEGAHAALDQRGRLRASRSRFAPCRSCARRSRRRPAAAGAAARRTAARSSASTISRAAERGQPVVQAGRGVVGGRSATGSASSMSPVSRPASICMMVTPVCGVAGLDRALDRRRAAPARQQRGVDVEAAEPRQRRAPTAAGSGRRRRPPSRRAAPPASAARAAAASSAILAVEAQAARLRHRQCRAAARTA